MLCATYVASRRASKQAATNSERYKRTGNMAPCMMEGDTRSIFTVLLPNPGESQGAHRTEHLFSDHSPEHCSDLGLVAKIDFFKDFGG